jgi:CRISPR/Cas system endoribonuclease Cas6 (RAMP superfamily)
MRVLVELMAMCDCVYDLMYHHKLQGFLYRLLAGSAYTGLHDRRGYKILFLEHFSICGHA